MREIALFGAGRIGRIHAGNIAAEPEFRLRYVVDVNATAAGELAAKAQLALLRSPLLAGASRPH